MVSVNFQNSASFSRYSHRKFSQMVIFRNCLFKKFIGHVLDNLMAAIWSSSQFSNILSISNCFSAFKCKINTGLLKLSFAQFQPSSYSFYYYYFLGTTFLHNQQLFNFESYIILLVMVQGWWVWRSFFKSRSRSKIRSLWVSFSTFSRISLNIWATGLKFCMWILRSKAKTHVFHRFSIWPFVFEISAAENFTFTSIFQLAFFKHLTMQYDASWREDSKYVIRFDLRGHLDLENDLRRSKIVNFQTIFFGSKTGQMGCKQCKNMFFMQI